MNNNFNIFSVAGKIVQDTILKVNSLKPNSNANFQQQISANNLNNYNSTSNILADFLANVQTQNMEFAQASQYMKDILSLPQEFKDLISQLKTLSQTPQNNGQNLLNILLVQNILGNNPKEALQTMIQQMAEMARKNIDINQMKELMTVISGNIASGSNSELVKNVMLLYIPFLPISPKAENLDWEIKEQKPDKSGNIKEEIVDILISTIKYQNIRLSLSCDGLSHVDVIVNCTSDFPKKVLTDFVKMFSKENNFTVKIAYEDMKQTENKNTKQSVKIMSGLVVNSCVMLLLQGIINFVLSMDLKKEEI